MDDFRCIVFGVLGEQVFLVCIVVVWLMPWFELGVKSDAPHVAGSSSFPADPAREWIHTTRTEIILRG